MTFFEMLKKRPRYLIIPLFCLFLAFYFAYHAITGERGLIRYTQITKEIEKEKELAAQTAEQKDALAQKVKSLSPENMDLDMLDEMGRKTLNVGEEGDFLIFENK